MDWKTNVMNVIEVILLLMLMVLGFITSVTDLSEGRIYNKVLLPFMAAGTALDVIYYGFFVRDIITDFIGNLLIMSVILLLLYYFHSFAGGDVKLGFVMACLYPSRMLFVYRNSIYTLFWTIGIAVIYGYVFLLISALIKLAERRIVIKKDVLIPGFKKIISNYFFTLIYVICISLLFYLLSNYMDIPLITVWVSCIASAWIVNKFEIFRNRVVIIMILSIDIILSLAMHIIPFSLYPETYLMTIIIILSKSLIKSCIYEQINAENVEKGMILSTASSILMQHADIEGIPGVSHEDLRDRLTDGEAEAVKKWAVSQHGNETIMIIRKIPFALFLLIGFMSYYCMWRIQIL